MGCWNDIEIMKCCISNILKYYKNLSKNVKILKCREIWMQVGFCNRFLVKSNLNWFHGWGSSHSLIATAQRFAWDGPLH